MDNTEKKIKEAFDSVFPPEADKEKKETAINRAVAEFSALSEKNKKTVKGSKGDDRLMGKIIKTIKHTLGGSDMTVNVRQLATVMTVIVALVIGTTIYKNQQSIPLLPELEGEKPLITLNQGKGDEQVKPALEGEVGLPEKRAETRQLQLSPQPKETAGKVASAPVAKAKKEFAARDKSSQLSQPAAPMVMADSISAMAPVPGEIGTADAPSHYYKDIGRDRFEKFEINPVKRVMEDPVSTFSVDVDTASYSFMRRQINSGVLPQKNSIRIEELINYFSYSYALPAGKSQPFAPTAAVYQTPWNSNTKLMHIGIKGYDLELSERPVSNLIFLIDVSGSMNSPDKLPLLKNSMSMLTDSLSENDSVGIVVYAGAAGVVLEPTKIKDKGKIIAALDRLQAGGSTAGGEGIRLAYSLAESHFVKDGNNRIILCSDGDFNVGIHDTEELKSYIEKKRKSGVYFSALGFGQGNYNDALMQALAQNGNGNAAYIFNLNEARKVLVDEGTSTLFTIAKDVKIQVEFNPATVSEYRLIGYETRKLNREDFNNDKVDAAEIGAGHSVTAIYEITPADAKEKLIDSLRYQSAEPADKKMEVKESEYAFLKIRYKLPGEETSKLITLPIDQRLSYNDSAQVPDDMRFAAAVAAFGHLVRNDPYTGDYDLQDVIELARSAKGDDPFGYRAEFINLVHLAQTARAL